MRSISFVIMALLTTTGIGAAEPVHDLVIYGGTSAGVAGGRSGSEDGQVGRADRADRIAWADSPPVDWGRPISATRRPSAALPASSIKTVRKHYSDPAAWKWQQRDQYMDGGQTRTAAGEDAMWTFEPSVALEIYQTWVKDHEVEVVYGERLDRKAGVAMTRSIPWRIVAIRHGVGTHVPRQDVHRRHLRRRPDGGGQRELHGRPRGELRSTARRSTACRPPRLATISSFPASIPTSRRASPKAGCCRFWIPTGRVRKARATVASRPTASACA